MSKSKRFLQTWGPAIAIMLVIFTFSSRPSNALPSFGWADALVKKGGHMLGYGMLSVAYWHALGWRPGRQPPALLLALVYATTDEFHQSFVPGRHPSSFDILVFDGLGGLLALLMCTYYIRRTFPPKQN
jgi:VanZ family protein